MNLLAEGNAGHESLPGQVVIDESAMSMVARSLKRAMEPVMTELREVKKQVIISLIIVLFLCLAFFRTWYLTEKSLLSFKRMRISRKC